MITIKLHIYTIYKVKKESTIIIFPNMHTIVIYSKNRKTNSKDIMLAANYICALRLILVVILYFSKKVQLN